jgi:hypothetical protein
MNTIISKGPVGFSPTPSNARGVCGCSLLLGGGGLGIGGGILLVSHSK